MTTIDQTGDSPYPVDSSGIEMGVVDDAMAEKMVAAIAEARPLFHGWTSLHGSASDDRASHGIACITIGDDDVEVVIPDRAGHSQPYTLTGADFTSLLGLIDQALSQPIAMEVNEIAEPEHTIRQQVADSVSRVLVSRGVDRDALTHRVGLSRADLDARLDGDCDFFVHELFRIADVLGMSVTELIEA